MTRPARLAAAAAALAALALAAGRAVPPAAAADWCGTDEVAADRLPDAVAGPQIHVVYAYPSDRPDRFPQVAQAIARDAAYGDRWWRAQDPTRTLRFDLYAFPGCGSSSGMLDISSVRLPREAAWYDVDGRTQGDRIAAGLPATLSDRDKKYLVYFDGTARQLAEACGHSPIAPASGGPDELAVVLLEQGAGCGALGTSGYLAKVAVHELIHNLGALPPGAPNACPDDDGHVCDDGLDIVGGGGGRSFTLDSYVLDAGRDDYYGHGGSRWDVRRSPWLVHLDAPLLPLAVRLSGGARGSVSSDLPGLSCAASCAVDWQAGTTVTLEATPTEAGASFVGWSGACGGTGACTVTLAAPTSVAARFERTVPLRVTVVSRGGTGTVALRGGGGDACDAGTCTLAAVLGALVDLVPTPAAGARLVGWSGACIGRGGCSLEAERPARVTAVFGPASVPLAIRIAGRGSVSGAGGRIACPGRCRAPVRAGVGLRLAARPARGWRLDRWTGACSGRGACVVEADAAVTVGAVFRRRS